MEEDNTTKLSLSRNCHVACTEEFLPLTEFLAICKVSLRALRTQNLTGCITTA